MATPKPSLLDTLRARTTVDCDTMDVEVAKSEMGPFADCTSNQAIAYGELLKPENAELVKEAISSSHSLAKKYPEVKPAELAVELAMVKLQHRISKYVTGFVHVQTNPYYSYDTAKTVAAARRIVDLFKYLEPEPDSDVFLCIKIPSTWEGLLACKELEASGIATLATTLFTMEQAKLAGEVGCHYIAPYVNELNVHFDPTFEDKSKLFPLCAATQAYYRTHNLSTKVLPASLTSYAECMTLAGANHLTIAPTLLAQLAVTPASSEAPGVAGATGEAAAGVTNVFESVFDRDIGSVPGLSNFKDDEAGWRMAFTRRDGGEGERKLGQAINIFCDMQDKLEAMMVEQIGV